MRKCLLILAVVVFAVPAWLPCSYAAMCEDSCAVSESCKSYAECQAAHLNCLAACKEKEAWEISAKASDKMAQAAEEMVKVLGNMVKTSEQTAQLLEKLVAQAGQKAGEEKNPSSPEK